jgi:hypothetical protein
MPVIPDEAFQLEDTLESLRGKMVADLFAQRIVRERVDFCIVAAGVDRGEHREQSLVSIELRIGRFWSLLRQSGEGGEQ